MLKKMLINWCIFFLLSSTSILKSQAQGVPVGGCKIWTSEGWVEVPCDTPQPPVYNPPSIDDEAMRLNDLTSHFNALLGQLSVYEIPNIGDLYSAATPSTIDDLRQRVDHLYIETAFYKERRYWKYEKNTEDLIYVRNILPELRSKNITLKDNLNTAPERLKKAEVQRDQILEKVYIEEHIAYYLWNNAEIMEYEMVQAKADVKWTIYELLPNDRKVAFIEAIGGCCFKFKQELPVIPIKVVAQILPTPIRATASNFEPYLKPRSIEGSIEVKLKAFDDLRTVLNFVSDKIPSQEKSLAVFVKEIVPLRKNNESLLERLQTYESPLEKAQELISDAEQRILTAQVNQEVSAKNLLILAAGTFTWNQIKNDIVIPEIEKILKKNGLLYGLKGMAMIDQIRKNPQKFIPKVGPLKDIERLIETEKKVLSIEENFESYSLAAANANAQIGTKESDKLVEQVFLSLGKQATDIMRTASGSIEGPLGQIARVIMERGP
ncbi:hypothetical protein [Flavobacterium gawalongense]|uniref:Uncharacterized protein n=1 Tax=Flavobacterium gawalongense TaxID=2594432 RepID=A0ABY3CQ31_9FLAO|nr:hypothetical protein [Flavobacterium gawalongense]TRX03229.1 hypothetical protein FNW33_05205 [Flavobacterium gawalongense]TRX09891.1 hypothetical protein FNW12_01895 [Flavobacterium gawalongense]